ncbi:MAG TPA: ABC transporter permease [Acidimicrobiales bacterium]|nr:ABC transporter permease [Acidimicrobiales bacterium]
MSLHDMREDAADVATVVSLVPEGNDGGAAVPARPVSRGAAAWRVGRFVVLRLAAAVLVLVLVSVIVFGLVLLIPGDPAVTLSGELASETTVAATQERLGLDEPLVEQYLDWATAALRGDLGTSLRSGTSVSDALGSRLPATLSLAVGGLIVTVVLSVGLGTLAGMRRGTWVDRVVTAVSSAGIAMPPFWVALLLVVFVAEGSSWFPATRYTPATEGLGPWFRSLVLPSIALGLAPAGEATRQVRGVVATVVDRDYVRAARAKGLRGRTVVARHVLLNAATTIVVVIGLQATILLGGTVLVEQVFNFQGIGSYAFRAVQDRDLPAIQAVVLLLAVCVLLVNLVVDLATVVLDPRRRAALVGGGR